MNEKYLVLRVTNYRSVGDAVLPSCLELVREFEGVDEQVYNLACRWAKMYSEQSKLQTVVIKGAIFGV